MNRIQMWWTANWWWLVPVFLGVALMVPRMASPEFGVADDGAAIVKANQMLAGTWTPSDDVGAGRFRPLYWLSFGLVYALAGQRPFWFFLYNTLLLAGNALLIMYLMRREGASAVQASLGGTLFVLSGPVIESFYTLTKIEPLQVLLNLSAIALASLAAEARTATRAAFLAIPTLLAAFLAFLCKETTLVMLPITLTWLGGAWLCKASRSRKIGLAILMAAFVASALVFWLVRAHYVLPQVAGYAAQYQFRLDQISVTAYRWGGWLIRDFPYLFPCLLFLGWQLWQRRAGARGSLLFASAVWMFGWAAIFMPWVFTVEYYILPFAAGCAIFCGLLIGDMIRLAGSVSRGERSWGLAALAFAILLIITTLPSNYSNGRLQLVMDSENDKLLDNLASTLPRNARLLVNLDRSNAYVAHIERHLQEARGRVDLTVLPFSVGDVQAGDYVMTFILRNQPMFFVRLGTEEQSARQKNSRLRTFLGPGAQLIFSTEATYRQSDINLVHLACFAVQLDFCADGAPAIDNRPLTYGGTIYRVPSQ